MRQSCFRSGPLADERVPMLGVEPGLQRSAEKLVNRIHAKKNSHGSDSPWWPPFWAALNDIADKLTIANTETIQAPLLWKLYSGET